MANTCTICKHDQRTEIDAALARGESKRTIANRFGVSDSSVQRHKACITEFLREARKSASIDIALDIQRELRRASAVVHKILDACEDELTDPEDNSRYSLAPRAEEVSIIYAVPSARGKAIRKKDLLSTLITRIEKSPKLPGLIVERVEMKTADPRELLIKASGRIEHQIEILARLTGAFKDRPVQPQPEQDFDLIAMMIEREREQGREITREEGARLVDQEREEFRRLARKTGHELPEDSTTVH